MNLLFNQGKLTKMKENLIGYRIDNYSSDEYAGSIFTAVRSARCCTWLACLNVYSYAVALEDNKFNQALTNADWLIPDGVGVMAASRFLGGSLRRRVTGSDIFFSLHQRINDVGGMSVFFLGSTDETLNLIIQRMKRDYPNIIIAGTYSPPFKPFFSDQDNEAMLAAINAAAPDILWVGMTAPKQEKWIFENRSRLNVKFTGAIGAVFDFYAGKVRRAPLLFQKLGLEWLLRLLQQPRRMWRRTKTIPIFILHVFRKKFLRI
jgi:N-acetylglucosaminyldiphosphoundecaprenol N-acetyl-beta-D-mannosaminyltransferase